MRAIATSSSPRKGKRHLLASCAIGAGLAALAYGGPALAQVQGTGTFVTGTGSANGGSGTTTTTTVTQAQSVINWVPTDTATTGGDIDLLPAGSTWNFVGPNGYTVLNRFVNGAGGSLSRQIALNGTVNSYVGSTTGARGGNIWFYNAGGILIGATGVINVGSLVLTTNDIVTTGGLFGPGGTIRFRGAAGSTSRVTVNGTIDANQIGAPGSSYVAVVAPRITQAGSVSVYGSAAYVAAEQADVRINAGLFDINVLVGAEGGTAINHSGVTTGPEQQTTGPAQRIYMVAIPKNVAVTMLVSGQVGYQDEASSVTTDSNGAVVLSAGYNVTNGVINTAPVNATAANIGITDAIIQSNITAHASGIFLAQPLSTIPPITGPVAGPPPLQVGRLIVRGNANFTGDAAAVININAGRQMGVSGNLVVQSGGVGATPGSVSVNINGGQAVVGGNLTIDATRAVDAATGASTGGAANLSITNSGILTTQNLLLNATGTGGRSASGAGGAGTGGAATVTVSGPGSTLSVSALNIDAGGLGGGFAVDTSTGALIPADIGGDGRGGTASLAVSDGANLSASSGIRVAADGEGQFGTTQSGSGAGGAARVTISGLRTTVGSPVTLLSAAGYGGGSTARGPSATFLSANGGDGFGGIAELLVTTDASSSIGLGDLDLDASAYGGEAGGAENATGGEATGGTANVAVDGDGTLFVNGLSIASRANGGGAASTSGTTARSGHAQAGNVTLGVTGGAALLVGDTVNIDVTGTTYSLENVGSGTGGTVNISATEGGLLSVQGTMSVLASGGSEVDGSLSAGDGTGGTVDLLADTGGTITNDNFSIDARGSVVGAITTNGTARGGTVRLTALNGGEISSTNDGTDTIDTGARTGYSQNGGSAFGGDITLFANEGRISLAFPVLNASGVSGGALAPGEVIPVGVGGNILIRTGFDLTSELFFGNLSANADGSTQPSFEGGGDSILPSGDGQGGTVSFEANGGAVFIGRETRLSADGYSSFADGNSGRGGTATFTQIGGTVEVGDLTVSANGYGSSAFGEAGDGFGGNATINFNGGDFFGNSVRASAAGVGGDGRLTGSFSSGFPTSGDGGQGVGGTATINVDGSATINAAALTADASGTGGNGGDFYNFSSATSAAAGNGGLGYGGNAVINLVSGSITTASISADALGLGGAGGSVLSNSSSGAANGFGVGGNGGRGEGGTATINVGAAVLSVSESVRSQAAAIGGAGGGATTGGDGGIALGGLAQAIVTDYDAGSLIVGLDASAQGGNGGGGADGDGGDGGEAIGGRGRVEATGLNANVIVSQANFLTTATGGNGGDAGKDYFSSPTTAGTGGNGGYGTGGTIEIVASEGGTVGFEVSRLGGVGFSSVGNGGNGGRGADNPNTLTLPGRDGMLGTADDIVQSFAGGDGGVGGGGVGGTVHLLANGGTISSNGTPIAISVNGISGQGGEGGVGSGGTGFCCSSVADQGGRVIFEALATPSGPGQIALGDTTIDTSGVNAGRIEMFTDGAITMDSLLAEALGFANPTNNDTDTASQGIFLAATGGRIGTVGDLTLRTGGSVGSYAQGGGQVSAGGNILIEADDQVDVRHEYRGENNAATLLAGDGLTIRAGNGISGAAGSLLDATNLLLLQTTTVNGGIGVDRLHGGNIQILTDGAANVEHAEADNNLFATVGSFRTGLNSIMTGGNIDISAVGNVDLGNSTAGGYVYVNGSSISFNAIDAGSFVDLFASGTTAGDDGIYGGSITSGSSVYLYGGSVAADTVTADGFLSATAVNGDVAIAQANTTGGIGVSAQGNVTGSYNAGGDIYLSATGDITASARAIGENGGGSSSGTPTAASVFADADGNLVLTDSAASGMFGVNAGGSASITGATAGEDMLVLAGTTATLADIDVGDDLTVRADGDIGATNLAANGTGPDSNILAYNGFGFTIGQGEGSSAIDGSDISLTSANGSITAATLSAGDDIVLRAANGAIGLNGATTLGLGTTDGGSNIDTQGGDTTLAGLNAFTDVLVSSTGTIGSTGMLLAGRNIVIGSIGAADLEDLTAGGFVDVDGSSIAFNAIDAGGFVDLYATDEGIGGGSITSDGSAYLYGSDLAIDTIGVSGFLSMIANGGNVAIGQATATGGISASAAGDVTGSYNAADDIILYADGDITASARAIGDGGFGSSSGFPAGASVFADAGGNVVLTDSAATRMFGVKADGAASITGTTVGEDMLVLAGTTATLADISVGDDLTVNATGDIGATNLTADGTGPDNYALFHNGYGFTIGQGEGSSATDGSDISLTSANGSIAAATLSAGDDIILRAANGAIGLDGATTLGLGVTDGDSNIDIQGGDATLAGLNAFSDILVSSTGTVGATDTLLAGRNVIVNAASAINLGDVTAGGYVDIDGSTIAFDAIDADSYVDLFATGTTPGDEGIDGGSIDAGGSVYLSGNSIAVDRINADGFLSATADGGDVAIGQATVSGGIGASAAGNLTGAYAAADDIYLSAGGDITASARAIGDGNVNSSGGSPTRASLFVNAAGNVVLTDSAASGMFGVNAGGSASITGATAGEDMLVLAGTTASLADIGVGDDLTVSANGDIGATNLTADGTGPDNYALFYNGYGFTIGQGEGVSMTDGSDISLTSAGGSITAGTLSAGDDIILRATNGAIDLDGATTLGLGTTGGASNIDLQGGDMTLANLNAFSDILADSTGNVTVTANVGAQRDVLVAADGDVNVALLLDPNSQPVDTIAAGRNLSITAGGSIADEGDTGGAMRAGGDLVLTAGGEIDIRRAVAGPATLALSGDAGVTAYELISGGATALQSANGAINVGPGFLMSAGPVSANGASVSIVGGGDLTFSQLNATAGDIDVNVSGNLVVTAGQATGRADLYSTGDIVLSQFAAADLELYADDNMTLGNVSATNTLTSDANRLLTVNGAVAARDMSIGSGDITIAQTGRLGTLGTTQTLEIRNINPTVQTFVGGTGTRNGYHIDATEMTRLFGTDISIFAPRVNENLGGFVSAAPGSAVPIATLIPTGSNPRPDLIVDSFTMTAGSAGNIAANGSLTLQTPGWAQVIGDVRLTGLSDTTSLNLYADDLLQVILGQGTIRLLDAGNAAGGQLNMVSEDVVVATASALTDIGNAADIGAINTRLGQNDGITLNEGALTARGIRFDVIGGVYVQNSGAGTDFGQRRGLTFGAGGLDILTEDASTRIVINGIQAGANGPVTGLDAIPLLTIDGSPVASGSATGAAAFDALSTFNGCVIANVASCTVRYNSYDRLFPVQDVIENENDGGDSDESEGISLPTALITMRDLDPLTGEPLLDDPVTGAGNDDLWTPTTDTQQP